MKRFRWGVCLSLAVVVIMLSGCEGFKFVRRSEYERLRSLERLNKEQAALITALTHDNERLTDQVNALKSQLVQSERAVKLLEAERERWEDEIEKIKAATPAIEGLRDVEVKQRFDGIGIIAGSDVLFDTGSDDLKAQGKAVLAQLVPILKERTNNLRISGYTDSVWTGVSTKFKSNFHLSGMRALSVLNYLKSKGVDAGRLHFAGYGEHDLIIEGGKENKKRSRRVEIVLLHDWATRLSGDEVKPK